MGLPVTVYIKDHIKGYTQLFDVFQLLHSGRSAQPIALEVSLRPAEANQLCET